MRGPPSEERVSDLCQKLSASPKDTQHRAQPVTLPVSTKNPKQIKINSSYNLLAVTNQHSPLSSGQKCQILAVEEP